MWWVFPPRREIKWNIFQQQVPTLSTCNTLCRTKLSMITVDHCITPYHFLWSWNPNWDSSIMHFWSPIQKISKADQATVVSHLHSLPRLLPHTSLMQRPYMWIHVTDHSLRTNDFECPGPSFVSLVFFIDFAISALPKIHLVFLLFLFIKTHTNRCLCNEVFFCWPVQLNVGCCLWTKWYSDHTGWEMLLYSALLLPNWIIKYTESS